MGSTRRWREDFIAAMARGGVPTDTSRLILRHAATLQRLAEAQCNGDWPADNGERKVIPCGGAEDKGCGSYWVPSVLAGKERKCPDCRTSARVLDICKEAGIGPVEFAGDPRGCVVKVTVQGREIGVPA